MAESTFKLEVYTGRGLEFSDAVSEVLVPGSDGQIGFLPEHCDYVGVLGSGLLEAFSSTDSSSKRLVVSGGFCRFSENRLQVLADNVDQIESIDSAKAQREAQLLAQELGMISEFDAEWSPKAAKLERLKALAEARA